MVYYNPQPIKLQLVSKFLQYNKNKGLLKSDLLHNIHIPIKLDSISEFL